MDLRDIKEFIKDSLKYLIVVAIVFFIALFVVSFEQVIGPSMKGTLDAGDVTIVNKLVYKFRTIKRNEIVSINQKDKIMVKRVIGLPGEHIEYKDNKLYVNGSLILENNISVETKDFKLEDIGYETIPKDMYFVLGDNRTNSSDSREFGLVKKDEIIGKIVMRLYPFSKIKFY
jgi:signal peptidase I